MSEIVGLPNKIDFEGANNFRDMGGYAVSNNLNVKTGRLFRSDHLGHLTDGDQNLLAELGIRTVIDLRRQMERDEVLDRIDDQSVQQISLPVDAEAADIQHMRRAIEQGTMTAEKARDYLISANREFVGVFSPVFKQFLHLLLDESNYPIVFHCSAGKDRAGFAAALSLLAVGAPVETAMHDYLATNHCTANYVNGILDGLEDRGSFRASPETIRTLMQVSPEFLQAAFDTIAQEYDDLDSYFDQVLDFDVEKREQLTRLLCG